MNTPICDFVKDYVSKDPVRLHMPGHKGSNGGADSWIDQAVKYDITEIDGADYLSAPCGIIAESEENAGKLFGCHTLYSTEGSSLCIRAMMFLVRKYAKLKGHEPLVLAGRNAHASFVNAAALLDINVEWIMQKESDSYESCSITGEDVEKVIKGYLNTEYLIKKLPDAAARGQGLRELGTCRSALPISPHLRPVGGPLLRGRHGRRQRKRPGIILRSHTGMGRNVSARARPWR